MGRMLLVAVDAHSKWPEVRIMSSTTAAKTITVLRDLFARFGLPRQVVTDNGPQFISDEFKDFMRVNGIKHIRSAPYHPSTNGAAERMVQTMKQALKISHQEGRPFELALSSFLLTYRTTPHATTGVSPSSLFIGRELRTRLDLLAPNIGARVRDKQTAQKDHHDQHTRARDLAIGQAVWARNYREGTPWVRTIVTDQVGPLSYLVQCPNGEIWRRHIDQLRAGPCSSEEESPPKGSEDDFVMLPDATGSPTEPSSPVAPTPERESNALEEIVTSSPASNLSNESNARNEHESNAPSSTHASGHRYPTRYKKPPDRYSK